MTFEVCRICHLEKPLELFSKLSKGQRRRRCKVCASKQVNDYIKQRRKTDPEYREKLRKIAVAGRQVPTPESRAVAAAASRRRYAKLKKDPEAHAAFLAKMTKRRHKSKEDES